MFPDWSPDDPTHFQFLLEASIGPTGIAGADLFGFLICTPSWLEAIADSEGPTWGINRLVVSRYDAEAIAREVAALCRRVDGSDWQELAAKLGQFGSWEFDGYRELGS
jgi:hypothetical protein